MCERREVGREGERRKHEVIVLQGVISEVKGRWTRREDVRKGVVWQAERESKVGAYCIVFRE